MGYPALKFHLKPTLFYRGQKEFFENGAAAFGQGSSALLRTLEAQVLRLQATLARKAQVIPELMEMPLALRSELDTSYNGRSMRCGGHPEPVYAFENSRSPKASESLIPRAVCPIDVEPVQAAVEQ